MLFLAGVTSRIGLIATVNTTYADPYATARALASLDVLTHGRAGINLVTGAEPRAAGNHGRDAHADTETRYDRAEEFVVALRRLWDSWDEDAWIADAERGVLIDPEGCARPRSRAHMCGSPVRSMSRVRRRGASRSCTRGPRRGRGRSPRPPPISRSSPRPHSPMP